MQRSDNHWVVVNRNYKPIGSGDTDFADYEKVPVKLCIKSISPNQAEKLSYNGDRDNKGRISLYNDGCCPTGSKASMNLYLARLAVLMKLKTVG